MKTCTLKRISAMTTAVVCGPAASPSVCQELMPVMMIAASYANIIHASPFCPRLNFPHLTPVR
jgi:hypothetical protein